MIALGLIWFFVARPQRRRQNEQLSMQESLDVGDEIVTAGGLYGTVESLDEDEVAVEIAEGVVVRVARRAIAGVIPDEEDEDEDAEEGEDGGEDEAQPEAQQEEPVQPEARAKPEPRSEEATRG